MLLKEIKNRVLHILYESEDTQLNRDQLSDFIPEAKAEQLTKAVESLNDSKMIEKPFIMEGGDFILDGLSAKGIEYVEDNLLSEEDAVLDGLKDTKKLMKSDIKVDIDTGDEFIENPEMIAPIVEHDSIESKTNEKSEKIDKKYIATPDYRKLTDADVESCFGVDELAACYIKLINSVCQSSTENIAMLGIFAPWGRGKTYFFNKVKEQLAKQNNIVYSVVHFNAWKYQDKPAIWAYLFENVYHQIFGWFRGLLYSIIRNKWKVLRDLLLLAIPVVLTYLLEANKTWKYSSYVFSFLGIVIDVALQYYDSSMSVLKKSIRSISFKHILGVQDDIEKELESVLKIFIKKREISKKRVVLYVDDIDRCEHQNMVNVIESLRTVLENEEIRKRLVIVCSIDLDILKKALYLKYNFLSNKKNELEVENNDSEIEYFVLDQIDKLFVSFIALPKLEMTDMAEYMAKLSGVQKWNEETSSTIELSEVPADSSTASRLDEKIEPVEISDKILSRMILEVLSVRRLRLTPRQLRILFYRCLFAKNILYYKHENFTQELIEQIILRSYDRFFDMKPRDMVDKDDVIYMVVAY